jgi:hypothetical protein
VSGTSGLVVVAPTLPPPSCSHAHRLSILSADRSELGRCDDKTLPWGSRRGRSLPHPLLLPFFASPVCVDPVQNVLTVGCGRRSRCHGIAHSEMLDVIMLALTGGRERTRGEHEALMRAGGFRLERVVPTANPISVLVGVANWAS